MSLMPFLTPLHLWVLRTSLRPSVSSCVCHCGDLSTRTCSALASTESSLRRHCQDMPPQCLYVTDIPCDVLVWFLHWLGLARDMIHMDKNSLYLSFIWYSCYIYIISRDCEHARRAIQNDRNVTLICRMFRLMFTCFWGREQSEQSFRVKVTCLSSHFKNLRAMDHHHQSLQHHS